MSKGWTLIDNAPLETPGFFWGPSVAALWERDEENRGSYPMGHVRLSEHTGNRRIVTNWTGHEFTHFHQTPAPPHD